MPLVTKSSETTSAASFHSYILGEHVINSSLQGFFTSLNGLYEDPNADTGSSSHFLDIVFIGGARL